jgi:putative FmdB family regulatory protein
MPIFDFRCNSCRAEFEALCRDTRPDGLTCPHCGAPAPSRLISRFAVSRQLSPCGTPASERGAGGCGYNPAVGGCGRCSG